MVELSMMDIKHQGLRFLRELGLFQSVLDLIRNNQMCLYLFHHQGSILQVVIRLKISDEFLFYQEEMFGPLPLFRGVLHKLEMNHCG